MSSITPGARRVGIAAVGCALVLVPAAASSGSVDRASETKLRGSNFYSNCRFSHSSEDDPIVYPGQPGRSHSHTFFGNKSTNAFSTVARLGRATTTYYPRADHHSHMSYSRNYVCPRAQPVKVPLIRLNIRYPIDRGRGVSLASGGQNTAHADFFNTWNQRALRRLVDECFHGRCNKAQR